MSTPIYSEPVPGSAAASRNLAEPAPLNPYRRGPSPSAEHNDFPKQAKPSVSRFVAIISILLATAISYAPAVRDGFVWDDTALVLRDPLIRSWRLIPEGFNHYLFVDATPSDFYRPFQRLTYTIEYALFAAHPAPYHVTNVALHTAAAIALMMFAEALLGAFGCDARQARIVATIAALIWAIHPIHTAAVVYVSGRADPLAALFGFSGCHLILKSLVRRGRDAMPYLVGAGFAFLARSLSKEAGLLFPLAMVPVVILLKQSRALISLGVIAVCVGTAYLSLRLPAEHDPAPSLGPDKPLSVRPITMARAAAEYAGLLILPTNLHMERDVHGSFAGNLYSDTSKAAARELQTLLGIVLLVALAVYMARIRRRNPLTFALLVCALVTYLPVSGVIKLNASVAEHWIYVPSAFLLLTVVLQAYELRGIFVRHRAIGAATTVVCVSWVLFLGARTFVRTFDWKDQRTFLERTIAAGGSSARMLINLGALESSENHPDRARKYLEEALKKEPDQPFGLLEAATICIKQNDFTTAHELLGRAVQCPVVAAHAHELLAVLENKEHGKADLLRMRLATRTGSPNWSIEKRYVKLLAETGATAEAIQELRVCLQTEWYRAETWQLLAQLLSKTGQSEAATQALGQANAYDVHLSSRPAVL